MCESDNAKQHRLAEIFLASALPVFHAIVVTEMFFQNEMRRSRVHLFFGKIIICLIALINL